MNQPPISGPMTEEMPNTAAKTPWILPRSCGAMTSPMAEKRQHEQAAAAEALQGAGGDQEGHGGRRAPQSAEPARKMPDRDEHHGPAAVEVAELAVERRHDGGGEDVGGDHPAQVVEPAEVGDDGGQRGRDDGLVERGEQQQQADRDHDEAGGAGGLGAGRRRGGRDAAAAAVEGGHGGTRGRGGAGGGAASRRT